MRYCVYGKRYLKHSVILKLRNFVIGLGNKRKISANAASGVSFFHMKMR
ncbi:hypothetical protein C8R32_10512 [Nitrosospira sp. Nsp5]|uniref:Uncharacterized protein n=1 Tax=Nitrosospira multiformis TaxID=1231 RepID=A0ABY0TB91_9PROT|nr:hypothetical protein C8R32_10512 [Nitrosospira sp. Nsp5]SDQ56858.1 hypothetical protein SAMN05216402_1360 [Nitrosospira multiformis]